MRIDYAAQTLVVKLQYYEHTDDPPRVAAALTFEGVESISQITDLVALEKNASAGTLLIGFPRRRRASLTFIWPMAASPLRHANSVSARPTA